MDASAFLLAEELETAINASQTQLATALMRRLREIGVDFTIDFKDEATIDKSPTDETQTGQFSADSITYLKALLISRGLPTTQAFRASRNVTCWEEYDQVLRDHQGDN
jgi:hypothetical protein